MNSSVLKQICHLEIDERLKEFFQSNRRKVLYGAGLQSRICWDILRELDIDVEFIVAKEGPYLNIFRDQILVQDIDDVSAIDKSECDILIAVNEQHNHDIMQTLEQRGFQHIYWSNSWKRANYQLRRIFLEHYLSQKIDSYDISDSVIQYGDFKIVGCNRQPIVYTSMLIGEFADIIAPSIFGDYSNLTEGAYELGKVKLEKSDVVLDLGANIGMFSCVAASKGCHVYAFEPTPSTRELLKMNQRLYADFQIVAYAVCADIGKASFGCAVADDGDANTGENSLRLKGPESHQIEVDTITIDAFVEQSGLASVDFIKADIEGAERDMLRGARNTLAKFAPKLALCTYHLPDDKEVMEQLILEANPNYVIEHKWKKLYAYVPR